MMKTIHFRGSLSTNEDQVGEKDNIQNLDENPNMVGKQASNNNLICKRSWKRLDAYIKKAQQFTTKKFLKKKLLP